jgi:hypothetical protein
LNLKNIGLENLKGQKDPIKKSLESPFNQALKVLVSQAEKTGG